MKTNREIIKQILESEGLINPTEEQIDNWILKELTIASELKIKINEEINNKILDEYEDQIKKGDQ